MIDPQTAPLVSCLLVTDGLRTPLLRQSVDCYRRQTHGRRELVVVHHGPPELASETRRAAEAAGGEVVFLEVPPDRSLGTARNLSLEAARGEYLCQWDDDDLYLPARIATQLRAASTPGCVGSAYSEHLKLFSEERRAYWCDWSTERPHWRTLLCGSALFARSALALFPPGPPYPATGRQSDREEDLNVLMKLSEVGRVAAVRFGDQYVYRFHGANVYSHAHHSLVLKKRLLGKDALVDRRRRIEAALAWELSERPIEVHGPEGLAYVVPVASLETT